MTLTYKHINKLISGSIKLSKYFQEFPLCVLFSYQEDSKPQFCHIYPAHMLKALDFTPGQNSIFKTRSRTDGHSTSSIIWLCPMKNEKTKGNTDSTTGPEQTLLLLILLIIFIRYFCVHDTLISSVQNESQSLQCSMQELCTFFNYAL